MRQTVGFRQMTKEFLLLFAFILSLQPPSSRTRKQRTSV